jgi:hypothetical protein
MAHGSPRGHRVDRDLQRRRPDRRHARVPLPPGASRDAGQRTHRIALEPGLPRRTAPRRAHRHRLRRDDRRGRGLPAHAVGGRAGRGLHSHGRHARARLPRRRAAAALAAFARRLQLRLLRPHPEPVRAQPLREHTRGLPRERPLAVRVAGVARYPVGLRAGVRVARRRDHRRVPGLGRRDRGVPLRRGGREPGFALVRGTARRPRAPAAPGLRRRHDRPQPRGAVPYGGRRPRRRAGDARRGGGDLPGRDPAGAVGDRGALGGGAREDLRGGAARPADRLRHRASGALASPAPTSAQRPASRSSLPCRSCNARTPPSEWSSSCSTGRG